MNTSNAVRDAARQRLIGLLQKPVVEKKEKKPQNKRGVALLGFNLSLFFIDLVSAITVGYLTSPLYGVMTFLAGFLALILHENLFTNPHADMNQKWLAVGGMVVAIISTLGIGVISALLNVTGIAGTLLPIDTLEIAITVTLVVITVIHGISWGVYYFIDEGHRSEMSALVSRAYRDRQLIDFENAKKDIETVLELDRQLESMGSDKAELIGMSYQQHTGKNLIQRSASVQEDVLMPGGDSRPVRPALRPRSDGKPITYPSLREQEMNLNRRVRERDFVRADERPVFTLNSLLASMDMSADDARAMIVRYQWNTSVDAFRALTKYGVLPEGLGFPEFEKLYYELLSVPVEQDLPPFLRSNSNNNGHHPNTTAGD
jgi:hypothetical protein